MSEIDALMLQIERGRQYTLLTGQFPGQSSPVSGFDAFEAAVLYAEAELVGGAGTLTVLYEQSDDGETWETAHSFATSTNHPMEPVEVKAPKSHWRCTASADGGSSWRIIKALLVPAEVNEPSEGGGGAQTARLSIAGAYDTFEQMPGVFTDFPIGASSDGHGAGRLYSYQASPFFVQTELGLVCDAVEVTVSGIPDDDDDYFVAVYIMVANPDGTEVLVAEASMAIAAHTSSGTIDWSGVSLSAVAGSDLSWDSQGVHSAAGGPYQSIIIVTGVWDS